MGWDAKRRQRIPTANMSTGTVLNGINRIQTELENLNPPVEPTASELQDNSLSLAANRLWELDFNRLLPQEDYVINVQRGKKIYQEQDAANEPLFTFVDEKVFERPTYRAFRLLLDNYTAETGVAEVTAFPALAPPAPQSAP
jgi:poly(U)-specific endoribonuclease